MRTGLPRISGFPAAAALLLASGCAGTATVVSTGNAPVPAQTAVQAYRGPKVRIEVGAFDYQATERSDIGGGMADLLAGALINSDRFVVSEREHPGAAAQFLIRGTVTAFEPHCSDHSIFASSSRACINLDLRILDAATGRVIDATTVNGTSAAHNAKVMFTPDTLPNGLANYSDTLIGQAIRNTVESAADYIVNGKLGRGLGQGLNGP